MNGESALRAEIETLRARLAVFEQREPEREKAEEERRRYQSGLQQLDAWVRSLIRTGGDYQRFYSLVCDGIKDLVSADLSMLPLIDEDRKTFTYHAAAGDKAAVVARKTMPLEGGGLCGWVAAHGEALSVPDLFKDSRVLPDLARALDLSTGLLVPLRSREGVVGGLSAFRKNRPFDQIDEQLLTLFSQRITPALENMHLLRKLEERVAERTAALTEANALLQSEVAERKRAEKKLQLYSEELLEAKDEMIRFANIVSHDLRAPLISIKGFAKELQRALRDIDAVFDRCLPHLGEHERTQITTIYRKDVSEAITFINASIGRMDGQISSLLNLSRMGYREIKPEPVDMKVLTNSVLSSLAHQIEQRKTTIAIGALPTIIVDKNDMEQIIGNLLDNALKYLRPDRNGEITISAEQGTDEMVFSIRDNGCGIAAADIHRVFELFQRAGKQDVPGEGMGLAYVRTLVRRYGGRIWCTSDPEKGTTFFFTMPVAGREAGDPNLSS